MRRGRDRSRSAFEKLARLNQSGLDLDTLRVGAYEAVRRIVPFEAAFWAVADPSTLLFTRAAMDDIPPETAPAFVENEFVRGDVNPWTKVASEPRVVHSLAAATGGDLEQSPRFRDILRPIGFGDELRIAFADRTGVWGFMCLHRGLDDPPFSAEDAAFVRRTSKTIAQGIRTSILLTASRFQGEHPAVPGLVLLSEDLQLVGSNDAGADWLERIGDHDLIEGIPSVLYLVAAALRGRPGVPPRATRTLTRSGWASVIPSWMDVGGTRHIALLIEEPAAVELAPLIVSAFGLTAQESKIVGLLCRGSSTADISQELVISRHTVQDHMKSIFDKMGASNRRELVAGLLSGHYLPRAMALEPINRRGQFDH